MIGSLMMGVSLPAASFRSMRSNSTSMVMSVGLLMTTPSTPFSLCSQTYTTVPPKTGSCMAGIAIRKWLARFKVEEPVAAGSPTPCIKRCPGRVWSILLFFIRDALSVGLLASLAYPAIVRLAQAAAHVGRRESCCQALFLLCYKLMINSLCRQSIAMPIVKLIAQSRSHIKHREHTR